MASCDAKKRFQLFSYSIGCPWKENDSKIRKSQGSCKQHSAFPLDVAFLRLFRTIQTNSKGDANTKYLLEYRVCFWNAVSAIEKSPFTAAIQAFRD